ncbi:neutral/alkaline non-lysosomal ceramidase N-terminal domain-containing protein [Actinopolymorpha sp. B11F2]|uniref:neutral/alkaline non-lysosomal ceramidase N-terminal domain-containing protein n=1 Tax=Actinopolymorpha sp. B11F2 TaxID=3160862 RepID=UPI0032E44F6A
MLYAGMVAYAAPLPVGVPLGGYAFREGVSVGTHDPITATALVVRQGRSTVAIVSVDLVAVTSALRQRVLALLAVDPGLRPEQVLLAATHTHSGPGGPHADLHDGGAYYDADTADRLAATIARAVRDAHRDAHRDAEPVSVRAWAGVASGVASDRVTAVVDVSVPAAVAVLSTPGGRTIGAVANYACHPTVLDESNLEFSADYVHATRQTLRERLGTPVVLFLNGACGDLSTRYSRRAATFDEAARLGGVAADHLAALVTDPPADTEIRSHPAVDTRTELVNVRCRRPTPQVTRDALHGAMPAGPSSRAVRAARYSLELEERLAATHAGRDLRLPVQVLRFGPVAVVGLSVELFSAWRPRWDDAFPGVVMLACYANDYHGYAVRPETPAEAYERANSWLPDTAGGTLVDAATRLLGRQSGGPVRHGTTS